MKTPIRALIIDDEFRTRKALRAMIESFIAGVTVVGEAADVESGVAAIRELQPDLVFLDIKMPGKPGYTLLEDHVLPPFEVVFTTAYEDHAVRAMQLDALYYLVKPVDLDELQVAVDRFRLRQQQKQSAALLKEKPLASADSGNFNKVVLPTQEGFVLIDLAQVPHCEAASSYTIFHLLNGRKVVSTRTLKVFEEQFAAHYFQRIHHKLLVNLRHVETFNSKENFLVLTNGVQLDVSLRKKAALIQRLKEL